MLVVTTVTLWETMHSDVAQERRGLPGMTGSGTPSSTLQSVQPWATQKRSEDCSQGVTEDLEAY